MMLWIILGLISANLAAIKHVHVDGDTEPVEEEIIGPCIGSHCPEGYFCRERNGNHFCSKPREKHEL
ncbi:unnamed protein product [Enterobius vermicularis]|uniref:EGF-like domain-containing protein n=1 Tax=Enterobius vermicularis TaxID=51028 RepID=A0A0N4UZ76_ENTVE|nr:unnamed protein product [Enterobius vermicularis]